MLTNRAAHVAVDPRPNLLVHVRDIFLVIALCYVINLHVMRLGTNTYVREVNHLEKKKRRHFVNYKISVAKQQLPQLVIIMIF